METEGRLVPGSGFCRGTNHLRLCRRTVEGVVRVAILVSLALPVWSQQKSADLVDRSLEDLMNIQVTSVSKTEQTLSRTAAAVFVVTQEDIRRSGATNIP